MKHRFLQHTPPHPFFHLSHHVRDLSPTLTQSRLPTQLRLQCESRRQFHRRRFLDHYFALLPFCVCPLMGMPWLVFVSLFFLSTTKPTSSHVPAPSRPCCIFFVRRILLLARSLHCCREAVEMHRDPCREFLKLFVIMKCDLVRSDLLVKRTHAPSTVWQRMFQSGDGSADLL